MAAAGGGGEKYIEEEGGMGGGGGDTKAMNIICNIFTMGAIEKTSIHSLTSIPIFSVARRNTCSFSDISSGICLYSLSAYETRHSMQDHTSVMRMPV